MSIIKRYKKFFPGDRSLDSIDACIDNLGDKDEIDDLFEFDINLGVSCNGRHINIDFPVYSKELLENSFACLDTIREALKVIEQGLSKAKELLNKESL